MKKKMNPTAKKILIYSGLGLDVVVTVFLFVIAIIMLATMPEKDAMAYYKLHPGMITYLQAHPVVYLTTCVLPLLILLIGNIIILVLYINRAGKAKAELSDLSDDQKAALRAELMKDMSSEEKKEE